ncbi:hypothetical protein [Candidatus Poriferisodalis sp.]|uniref:hypothetical protein n=1 Tax=Candidatus Poriferisodalis sp. TaxID=3101277 RepID=UPI003C6FCF8C
MTLALLRSDLDDRLQTAVLLVAAFFCSLAITSLLWRWLGARMARDRWVRPNYRGQPVVAVGGLLTVAASIIVTIAVTAALVIIEPGGHGVWAVAVGDRHFVLDRSPEPAAIAGGIAALMLLAGLGWLGYRDDTRGAIEHQDSLGGFAGHLRLSWQYRRLTTGAQKALGGLAVALGAVQLATWADPSDWFSTAASPPWSIVTLLRGALIVALAANLANLLDRVPGRATKAALAWWLVALVPAAIAASCSPGCFTQGPDAADWGVWAAGAVGASAGLLRGELTEEHMQGDTGVNPLGAMLGMATVAVYSAGVEWVVLAVLAVLNLASERWSFSRIIDAVPPLRWLDRLGSPYR